MSKVWFITGAGRGIGAEIAKAALDAGDRVVATGRNVEQLEAAYRSFGEQVLCLELDVATAQSNAAAAMETAAAHFGRIDVLVNNAGYGQLGLFEEVTAAAVERQFETNVFGLMHVTRGALPIMRKQRSGQIVNLASIGGFMGFEASSIYCAAKFAVEGFSESLALEVARFGIKVTVVEPGFFRTDLLDISNARYARSTIADYAAEGKAEAMWSGYHGAQQGDPARLGDLLEKIAGMDSPPNQFVAGSDAFAVIEPGARSPS